eukprot:Skav203745  [mRNA]  locus=scaffold68:498183:498695:+ [translate_table: standard]
MSDRPVTQEQLDRVVATVSDLTAENLSLRNRIAVLEDAVRRLSIEDFEVVAPTPTVASVSISALTQERRDVAVGVGRWRRRCLNGLPRGPSGRDQTPQQSRYYLVCRSVDLAVFNPPKVFTTWSEAKPLCVCCGGNLRTRSTWACRPRRGRALQSSKLDLTSLPRCGSDG